MAKVHPNCPETAPNPFQGGRSEPTVVTVWRKSLLFNCSGFTVYDAKGDLVFRVDNYSLTSNGEIVLMSSSGKCLMTVRRKRLSLGENWLIYQGEGTSNPRFSIKKHLTFLRSKLLAQVTSSGPNPRSTRHSYCVEGSYSQNQCTIYDRLRKPVGEVKRKETAAGVALGCDVFRLVVESELDATLAMAIVIVLEQMYGS